MIESHDKGLIQSVNSDRTAFVGRSGTLSDILAWNLVVPLAFFLIVFLFFPYSTRFEFSTDEGNNLMMSMLVERGYSLYGEIWNDQPPLFTNLLATVFHFFGLKVGAARLLVLLFSTTLFWAFVQFMRMVWGNGHALTGALLLFLLPKYMILSVSAMVGLPALAFAMHSLLFLALWQKNHKTMWLLLSAVVLSMSILTKLFTGVLAPIFILGILIDGYARSRPEISWGKVLAPAMFWAVTFAGFTLGLGLVFVGPSNVTQLLEPHVIASQVEDFRKSDILTIQWHLREARPILFLALIGSLLTLRSKKWLYLYPLAWMISAYLFLTQLVPVWAHHQLLVTIPAAMLAAIAVFEATSAATIYLREHFNRSWSGLLHAATLIGLAALLFTFKVPEPVSLLRLQPSLTNSVFEMGPLTEKFFVKMLKFAPETNWVVTDLPMYAFRARLPVPPNLAVISAKRLETGNLPEELMLNTIQEYNPEQVLLGRFSYPLVAKYLQRHYRLIHSNDNMDLYVRKDLGK